MNGGETLEYIIVIALLGVLVFSLTKYVIIPFVKRVKKIKFPFAKAKNKQKKTKEEKPIMLGKAPTEKTEKQTESVNYNAPAKFKSVAPGTTLPNEFRAYSSEEFRHEQEKREIESLISRRRRPRASIQSRFHSRDLASGNVTKVDYLSHYAYNKPTNSARATRIRNEYKQLSNDMKAIIIGNVLDKKQ